MSSTERTYEIHEVALLTGLEPARLRAWERRYEIIRPRRQPNGYRVYTAEQVALLRAYASLIAAGERIGDLAARSREEVLAWAEGTDLDGSPQGALIDAVRGFDREKLEALVAQQLSLRGLRGFAEEVVLPLARAVGDLWALGKIPIAAEHLASEVVVHALKGGLRMTRANGPLVICGCLPGDRHEWGVLCALAVLQDRGWRIQYLGPDLPVAELVEAAWKLAPRVVALSASDPAIVEAALPGLGALPGRLPPAAVPVIGGSGATVHANLLAQLGYRLGLKGFDELSPEPPRLGEHA